MTKQPLTKVEAGALLRKRREELGMTQEQVVEQSGIPTMTQLSEYEQGKVNFARGKHFPGLIRVLRLSLEDIEAINPDYVVRVTTDAERRGWKLPVEPEPEIPANLKAAAERYGNGKHAPLATREWQLELAKISFREQPESPEDWLEVYLDLAKIIKPKPSN